MNEERLNQIRLKLLDYRKNLFSGADLIDQVLVDRSYGMVLGELKALGHNVEKVRIRLSEYISARDDNYLETRASDFGESEYTPYLVECSLVRTRINQVLTDIDSFLPPPPRTIGFQRTPIIGPSLPKPPRQIGFRKGGNESD